MSILTSQVDRREWKVVRDKGTGEIRPMLRPGMGDEILDPGPYSYDEALGFARDLNKVAKVMDS